MYYPPRHEDDERANRALPTPRTQDLKWADCAKATRSYNSAMVKSLRGDMDTLLVFASLFSAVVTAFVIDSYKGLNGTASIDTTAALFQQLLLHVNQGNTGFTTALAPPPAVASTSSICINVLWFSSLVLSLNTVLGAILAKQWLTEFEVVTCSTAISKSPRKQVALRQLKFDSFGRWKVTTIITYLPVQLICALFLFFAGLVYLVWTLNRTVAIITSIFVGISSLCFLATTVLPTFFNLCAFCSPQAWLVLVVSKWLQSVPSQPSGSNMDSVPYMWIDTLVNKLSHPSESTKYEMRALSWTSKIHAPWEPSLVPSLYDCVARLPSHAAAKVICQFFSHSGCSPEMGIKDRETHAKELSTAIGSEAYWRAYKTLLEEIALSRATHSSEEGFAQIPVFCSLHLGLCLQEDHPEPEVLLSGLIQLALILSGQDLKVPLDIERTMVATLTHISTHKDLDLPWINEACIQPLESFTAALVPPPGQTACLSFQALSSICICLWARRLHHVTDWTPLTKLLGAMKYVVESRQGPIASLITHWMESAFVSNFSNAMEGCNEEDALGVFRALLLAFRTAHDDGIDLSTDILERIDVLIVNFGLPEAVCATLFSAGYSGSNDPFSDVNLDWWKQQMGSTARDRLIRLLCDSSPLPTPSSVPSLAEIKHLRTVCELLRSWTSPSSLSHPWATWPSLPSSGTPWGNPSSLSTFPPIYFLLKCCVLSPSELSLWFPGVDSPDSFLSTAISKTLKSVDHRDGKMNESGSFGFHTADAMCYRQVACQAQRRSDSLHFASFRCYRSRVLVQAERLGARNCGCISRPPRGRNFICAFVQHVRSKGTQRKDPRMAQQIKEFDIGRVLGARENSAMHKWHRSFDQCSP
ncbi:hypothetical protein C8J57DRAFT_197400 [Mycena rebaudengoi]|nr:hypothetical protein C8J57DRAFT_197400 [Mycena rebaudengoi]